MTVSDDENESLAYFLETEVLSEVSDQEEPDPDEPEAKSPRLDEDGDPRKDGEDKDVGSGSGSRIPIRIDGGSFGRIPQELFPHILKFMSCEDLVSCLLVCRCLNTAASDASLWRRL